MRWLKPLTALVITVGVFWLLHHRMGMIPPLGKFMNPFTGFWQNGTQNDRTMEDIALPGLKETVQVVWDARQVPHIFANNDHDLYFAQGYITARDRLWQMEFQTHAAAGRLAEIFGKRALEHDRFRRRTGMLYAAENSINAIETDSKTWEVIQAYAEGVNTFIESLNRKHLPFEYKLFDYKPEPWSPLKSALLVKIMAWDLASNSPDKDLSQAKEFLDEQVMGKLYPFNPPFLDPIIPAGTRWDLEARTPDKPETKSTPSDNVNRILKEPQNPYGSNNWAVSGMRTESGYPILCADPHLRLSLPSIWYEIQLATHESNVYGVSLPGAPTVVIGFNQSVAWGLTAALSDVLDWYKIEFKDPSHEEYFHDGKWRPTTFRTERIKLRGGRRILERVCYTHHGPVVYHVGDEPFTPRIPVDSAMRWAAHDPSNELLTFYRLNRAQGYEDYIEALQTFQCPGHNFAFASLEGDIALWHHGKYPLRWYGQGRFICDGTDSTQEWQGWIPWEHNPHVLNPERGFISSANQKPTDASYPYYLGWDYASFQRGARINELLANMQNITPQHMLDMQNDVLSLKARMIVPGLVNTLASIQMTPTEHLALLELKSWSYEYRVEYIAPTIFEHFWDELTQKIWRDDLSYDAVILRYPDKDVTMNLILNHKDSHFFDDKTTEEYENHDTIVLMAFQAAVQKLGNKFGPLGTSWAWGKTRRINFFHPTQIPALSKTGLGTNGHPDVIHALSEVWGPSWRMVVSLESRVQAWGIYPGGQSGNPGSRFYENAVDDFIAGNAYPLLYLESPTAEAPGLVGTTRIEREK